MEEATNFDHALLYLDAPEEDELSLCDLPLTAAAASYNRSPGSPSWQHADADAFEFSTDPISQPRFFSSQSSDSLNRFSSSDLIPRSNSLRAVRPSSVVAPVAGASVRYSSFGTMRRHRALIGVTKIPTRMNLGDMRKRQSRQPPAPLFPGVGSGELIAPCDGSVERDGSCGGGSGHHWRLLRPLRCRSHLVSAWAKASLGCVLPHV